MRLVYMFLLLHSISMQPTSSQRDAVSYSNKSIIDERECAEISNICPNLSEHDDILILECLLSNPEHFETISKSCQNTIWNHTSKLIDDYNVKNFLLVHNCESDLNHISCNVDRGHYLKCILNNMKDIQNNDCILAIQRLQNVAFTDYRWIDDFLEHCKHDISALQCGRIDGQSFSQIKTVSCLQKNILRIKDDCKKEVFRLSEIQSNNLMLDTQLYVNCASDHARYCRLITPTSGRLFHCLMGQIYIDPSRIDVKCQEQLFRREKLISQDYRISKGLLKSCREDIKKTHCRKQVSSDKTIRLAQILLCLEGVMRNGTKVDQECEQEIIDHRRMLMEDYRLSPEILDNCKNETAMYCKDYHLGGKTIHCLMKLALNKGNSVVSKLGAKCLRALEDLVQETDAGENWSVDPVLHQACDPVVRIACKNVKGGNSRVISCLMDSIRTDTMTEECEDALIEIQYFIARDFKLDPMLNRACRKDAKEYCHSFSSLEYEQGPSYAPHILPCLYRQAYQENTPIEKNCLQQIQRVMRQRAISVDLQPEIEENCVRDLGAYCHDKFKKGEEIQCLQDKIEDLGEDCRKAVETFTEIEAEHVGLNPFISKYCARIIETLCNTNANNDDGIVMECLIENKNHADVKANQACRASIEHFQIISLKDYRFSYKFKIACKPYAMRLCGHSATKNEVVACLSEHILNSTVQGLKSSIPKDCRQQLKAQLFQQREKIDFDPTLKKICMEDIIKYCSSMPTGNAQVLECLQTVPHGQLSNKCSKEIFKIQKFEVYDNSVDYALITMCAETIDQFCPHHETESIFNCLKMNKDEKGFSKKCRAIVMHRLVEQNSNNLLNPSLQQNCQSDIGKFCKHELMANNENKVVDSVIKCLKYQFKLSKLSNSCEKEMADILRDMALNVNLNPLIRIVCKNELETICRAESEDSGKVEECLKEALINKNIQTPECRLEVANMIEESQADIQVDPLLQRACALDLLNYCNNVEQGNGRHIKCLQTVMNDNPKRISPECNKKLKERLEMYKNAIRIAPSIALEELYTQVTGSPYKRYFAIILLSIVGIIFLMGVFCGRISKRKYRLLKNK